MKDSNIKQVMLKGGYEWEGESKCKKSKGG
jgi:hypothetical protein